MLGIEFHWGLIIGVKAYIDIDGLGCIRICICLYSRKCDHSIYLPQHVLDIILRFQSIPNTRSLRTWMSCKRDLSEQRVMGANLRLAARVEDYRE